jgi:hypothetical protein
MKKGLKCSVYEQEKCVARNDDVCEYCGHVRCDKCLPDRWPWLADGCGTCLARILKRVERRVI